MCDWALEDEVIERDASGKPTVFCDPCIAPLVKALNDGGLRTVASCCAHGTMPGSVVLADGRELILHDFDPDSDTWKRGHCKLCGAATEGGAG